MSDAVIFDPVLHKGSPRFLLDCAALLFEKTYVADPSKENLDRWSYPPNRFRRLTANGVFASLYSGRPPDTSLREKDDLFRSDLLPNHDFFAQYEKAIEYDQSDDNLRQLIAETLTDSRYRPDDIIYCLDWDLIIGQLLACPILSSESTRKLWEYKITGTLSPFAEQSGKSPIEASLDTYLNFIYKITGRLPTDLEEEEILAFRKHTAAKRLRTWLRVELSKAMRAKGEVGISPSDHLLTEFNLLADSYERKSTRTAGNAATLAVVVANVIGFVSSQPLTSLVLTPVIHRAVTDGLPALLRRLWKSRSATNWVLLLLDLRKT